MTGYHLSIGMRARILWRKLQHPGRTWHYRRLRKPLRATTDLVVEEEQEPMGRIITEGGTRWRDLPLAVLDHDGVYVGSIDAIRRFGPTDAGYSHISGDLTIDRCPSLAERIRAGQCAVGIDGGDMQYEVEATDEGALFRIEHITILGVNLVPREQAPWSSAVIEQVY